MSFGLIAIISLIGLIVFFVSLASLVQGVLLKSFYTIVSMLVLLITLNTATVIATDNGSSTSLVKLLSTSYQLGIWIFFIILVIMLLSLILHFLQNHKDNLLREEED